jgi:hypothetical protein
MKLALKKDYVIPAGTVFEHIPGGMKRTYGNGNYETLISTSKDTVMSVNVTVDELTCTDLFKEEV